METITLEDVLKNYGVDFEWGWGADEDIPDWAGNALAYTVTIKRDNKRQSFPYYKGRALPNPPEVVEVMNTLLSDWESIQHTEDDFADWAWVFGYSTDSISAKDVWLRVKAEVDKLRFLFTEQELYNLFEIFNEDKDN